MKFEDMINTIQLGNCYELIKQMPDKSIDLIVTDPCYFAKDDEWCNEIDPFEYKLGEGFTEYEWEDTGYGWTTAGCRQRRLFSRGTGAGRPCDDRGENSGRR